MATIKSYTDIEQSKKLAEILPIESADMWWSRCTITDFGDGVLKVSYAVEPCNISQFRKTKEDIPCWSLGALLEVLSMPTLEQDKAEDELFWQCSVYNEEGEKLCETYSSDKVDACYEMVVKLNELNLL